jgi:hypothetical protein
MKHTFYSFILFLSVSQYCSAQNILDSISVETNKCMNSFDFIINTDNEIHVSIIRECLESATERNIKNKKLLKYYKIKSLKEFDFKAFCIEVIPYLSKKSSITQKKLKKVFKDIIEP